MPSPSAVSSMQSEETNYLWAKVGFNVRNMILMWQTIWITTLIFFRVLFCLLITRESAFLTSKKHTHTHTYSNNRLGEVKNQTAVPS